jgi:hypothetical protein
MRAATEDAEEPRRDGRGAAVASWFVVVQDAN